MTFQIERADMGQASPQGVDGAALRNVRAEVPSGVSEHPRPLFSACHLKARQWFRGDPLGKFHKGKRREQPRLGRKSKAYKLTVLGPRNSTQRCATIFNLDFITSHLTVSSNSLFHRWRHVGLAVQGPVPDSYVLHIAQLSRNAET